MVEPDNRLIYEILQRMQSELGEFRRDVRELTERIGLMEAHFTSRFGYIESKLAEISLRLDRQNSKLDRVFARLDLVE